AASSGHCWTVRLVAGIAGRSARVFLRHNLRKVLWLGDVRLVATDAQLGGIQLRGLHRRRIVGMLGERPVARLAGNSLVYAFALYVEDIGMAALADLVASVGNRQCRNLGDCLAAIMSVLSKTARDEGGTQHDESDDTHQKDGGHPEKVSRIFEIFHNGKFFKLFRRYKSEVSACRVPCHQSR